jgi:hypothetical protein
MGGIGSWADWMIGWYTSVWEEGVLRGQSHSSNFRPRRATTHLELPPYSPLWLRAPPLRNLVRLLEERLVRRSERLENAGLVELGRREPVAEHGRAEDVGRELDSQEGGEDGLEAGEGVESGREVRRVEEGEMRRTG